MFLETKMAATNNNNHDGPRCHLTIEKAKAALNDVLASFALPENITRLEEAKDNAGNDMLKIMQMVFPVATQIQIEVIQNYGFSGDGEGAIQFAQAVRGLEKEDPELAQLNADVRAYFIPQMVPQLPPQTIPNSTS